MAGLLEKKNWQQLVFNTHQELKMAIPWFLYLIYFGQLLWVPGALKIKGMTGSCRAIVAMCSRKSEPAHWIISLLKEQKPSPLWLGKLY